MSTPKIINLFRSSSWILFSVCVGVCQSTSLATVISISGRSRGSRNAAVKLYCSRGIHQMMFAIFTSDFRNVFVGVS